MRVALYACLYFDTNTNGDPCVLFLLPPRLMKSGYMNVTNYTEAAGSPGTWAKTTIRGKGDPGYSLTAGAYSLFSRLVSVVSLYLTSAPRVMLQVSLRKARWHWPSTMRPSRRTPTSEACSRLRQRWAASSSAAWRRWGSSSSKASSCVETRRAGRTGDIRRHSDRISNIPSLRFVSCLYAFDKCCPPISNYVLTRLVG